MIFAFDYLHIRHKQFRTTDLKPENSYIVNAFEARSKLAKKFDVPAFLELDVKGGVKYGDIKVGRLTSLTLFFTKNDEIYKTFLSHVTYEFIQHDQ